MSSLSALGRRVLIAALCAADLGARVVLVARTEFGGMMANDGPVPVRTLS